MGGDVPHVANLAGAQREPAADQGGHYRVAVARNEQTRYKTYWAMVIAEKPSQKKEPKATAERRTAERQESAGVTAHPSASV
jgi:hypothetical protein